MTTLKNITKIEGDIIIKSGLHIGGSDNEIRIGGINNQVIKNPITNYPIIPGSSLKGKIRTLLEWRCGHDGKDPLSPEDIEQQEQQEQQKRQLDIEMAKNILRLFGTSAGNKSLPSADNKSLPSADNKSHPSADNKSLYGVARLSFYDCDLNQDWIDNNKNNNSLSSSLTEEKLENTIDRISAAAINPRRIERVPAGAKFDFAVSIRVLGGDKDNDLLNTLYQGMKLLTYDSLGGSGSRGYGKIEFKNLKIKKDGSDIQENFNQINPFDKNSLK